MRTRILSASLVAVAVVACSPAKDSKPEVQSSRVWIAGNINPLSIQIDGPTAGADLFQNVGTPLNAGATVDWVADSAANGGTGCLGPDAIASCIEPGITGADGGTGHWTGVRIVDGIAGNDQDIFVKGGKENDANTWQIEPGTVGSSKFDMVQAYLANNQTQLFFGMERAGTNGTTAFDFEFNQKAPATPDAGCVDSPLIPCRTLGDVLFTFEMQGAGNTGSATPFVFVWNGSAFATQADAGVYSSINNSATTAGGPWGHVNSHGDWVLGNLDRFQFAEALAPLSLLPGVNACGGSAWVQVRTRSAASETSDLKDTSRIFEFLFNSIVATATLTPSCAQGFFFSASAVTAENVAVADAGCAWTFSDGTSSSACSGFRDAGVGTYTGTVSVSAPALNGCSADDTSGSVAVYAPLAASADLTATCAMAFTYDGGVTGGSGDSKTLAWAFTPAAGVSPTSSSTASGAVAVTTAGATYTGTLTVTDPRNGLNCTASASDTAVPYGPLSIDLALVPSTLTCPGLSTDAVTWNAALDGGVPPYTVTWYGASCSGSSCTVDPADATYCASASLYAVVSDSSSSLCPAATSETETYSKVTTVTASNNP